MEVPQLIFECTIFFLSFFFLNYPTRKMLLIFKYSHAFSRLASSTRVVSGKGPKARDCPSWFARKDLVHVKILVKARTFGLTQFIKVTVMLAPISDTAIVHLSVPDNRERNQPGPVRVGWFCLLRFSPVFLLYVMP